MSPHLARSEALQAEVVQEALRQVRFCFLCRVMFLLLIEVLNLCDLRANNTDALTTAIWHRTQTKRAPLHERRELFKSSVRKKERQLDDTRHVRTTACPVTFRCLGQRSTAAGGTCAKRMQTESSERTLSTSMFHNEVHKPTTTTECLRHLAAGSRMFIRLS